VKRREFITLLGGVAAWRRGGVAAWPLARRFNSLSAHVIVGRETIEGRLPKNCAGEARRTLRPIFRRE
jgi:hypothetical protein